MSGMSGAAAVRNATGVMGSEKRDEVEGMSGAALAGQSADDDGELEVN